MILGRRGEVELEEDARDVLLGGAWRDEEPVGDRLVRATLGHELEHLALTRSQERERIVPTASAEELGDDGGVESGAPFRDAPHGRRELVVPTIASRLGTVFVTVSRNSTSARSSTWSRSERSVSPAAAVTASSSSGSSSSAAS